MPWGTQPIAASVAFLHRIAADHGVLLELDDAATDWLALVRQPIHGRGGDLLWRYDFAGGRILRFEVLVPIRRQAISDLGFDLIRCQYPTHVEMIDPNLFVTKRVRQVPRERHQRSLRDAICDQVTLAAITIDR